MPVIMDPERIEEKNLFEMADFTGTRVLEVGCGDGRLTWLYAERTARVSAIDPMLEDIETARINTPSHLRERIKFYDRTIDAFVTENPGPEFDIVLFSWSL